MLFPFMYVRGACLRLALRVGDLWRSSDSGEADIESVFSRIYKYNLWGNHESVSGSYSTLSRTVRLRQELPALIEEMNITSLLDAPCGDFNWMQHVDLNLDQYVGADVVPELVATNRQKYGNGNREFTVLDITQSKIPAVDLIMCRDCWIHFSHNDVTATIANFKQSKSKYLLTTTYPGVHENVEISTGQCRPLNLLLPPFGFPPPLKLIVEQPEIRGMGLWRLEDL